MALLWYLHNMTGAKKILIVEDDESLREVYTVLFREAGFEVLVAKDGQEAWDFIAAGRIPSVILTGIIMPRLTGFELIKRLRIDPALAKIPVIVSSHRGLPEDRKQAEDLGVKEFFVRHMTTPGEVLRRVNMLFGGEDKFKISFFPDRHNGRDFLKLIESQQGKYCSASAAEVDLEIESTREKGVFKIRLEC